MGAYNHVVHEARGNKQGRADRQMEDLMGRPNGRQTEARFDDRQARFGDRHHSMLRR